MNNSFNVNEIFEQLLLQKTETKNLDYKQSFNWQTATKPEKCKLVKDIIAMANTQDGGNILFGVEDNTFNLVGLSEEDYLSFDTTDVNNFLHSYTDPKHSCNVSKPQYNGKDFVIISVPEFDEDPIICKKDANDEDNRLILQEGSIYIRTESAQSTDKISTTEMRELLGRAITKKGDELLASIERLIKGKPTVVSNDSQAKYDKEIEESKGFFDEKLGKHLTANTHWEVISYPIDYKEQRINNPKQIRTTINQSQVRLRGWYFPHFDKDPQEHSYFNKGDQNFASSTFPKLKLESYRAYTSGLFIFKGLMSEDKNYDNGLSFLSIIYSTTEFILFIKRYYEGIELDETDIYIQISLNNIKDKKLIMDDLEDDYISQNNLSKLPATVNLVNLKASYFDIACKFIKHTFLMFNYDNISDSKIEIYQRKLLKE